MPQSVDKRCRRSHGRVERLAMDGPLVSRYLTLANAVIDRHYSELDLLGASASAATSAEGGIGAWMARPCLVRRGLGLVPPRGNSR